LAGTDDLDLLYRQAKAAGLTVADGGKQDAEGKPEPKKDFAFHRRNPFASQGRGRGL